jgi:hypothetical protein
VTQKGLRVRAPSAHQVRQTSFRWDQHAIVFPARDYSKLGVVIRRSYNLAIPVL